jgi:flagellar hook-associated protein 3 FlgL
MIISQRAVTAMLQQQAKTSETQLQISTGRRVLTPSDDPASSARLLDLNGALETVQQYQSNIERAKSRLETEEGVLDGMTNLLQRAGELAIQGNNDTLSANDTQAVAAEVEQILEQFYAMANTKDSSGEYIFAGYQSGTKPFTNPAIGTYSYQGDLGQRQLQISADRRVADSDSGYELFVDVETATVASIGAVAATDLTALANGDITIDGGNGNGPVSIGSIPAAGSAAERAQQLMDAINAQHQRTGVRASITSSGTLQLASVGGTGVDITLAAGADARTGLTAGNTPATNTPRNVMETLYQLTTELENNRPVDRYIEDIRLALENLVTVHAAVGGRLSGIDQQYEVNADLELSLESSKSAEEDLDYAEAIARFERQMTALQAAQQSYVKIKELSLFNYIR